MSPAPANTALVNAEQSIPDLEVPPYTYVVPTQFMISSIMAFLAIPPSVVSFDVGSLGSLSIYESHNERNASMSTTTSSSSSSSDKSSPSESMSPETASDVVNSP